MTVNPGSDQGLAAAAIESADAALEAAQRGQVPSDRMLAEAQVHALRAIFYELRRRHDQPAPAPSGLWVRVIEHKDWVRYVRGDQIVEIRWLPVRDGSGFAMEAVVDDPDGRTGRGLIEWQLPDQATAAAAARTLLELLGSDRTGVVLLSDDHQIKLVPFAELTAGV